MDIREILKRVDHTLLKQGAVWEDIKEICDLVKKTIKGQDEAIKTIVTSDISQKVADKHNCKLINVLTGFKFIGWGENSTLGTKYDANSKYKNTNIINDLNII